LNAVRIAPALLLLLLVRPATAATTGQGMTVPVPDVAAGANAAAPVRPQSIALTAGSGHVISLSGAAANIFVADPKVVQVRPASPTAMFVFGTSPGRTTIAALSADGRAIAQYEVTVRPSAYGAGEAASAIARQLPGVQIQVETTTNGVALSGEVTTPAQAEQAETIARSYIEDKQTVENRLHVTGATQVLLKVRIAEMSRSVTRQLGVDWQAIGALAGSAVLNPIGGLVSALPTAQFSLSYVNKGVNVSAVIDALARDNLAKVLAEPNLTAISGESANFLAGGEYPIPVSQALGTTTVQYKDYGVSLAFRPTVLSDGRISLQVRPEVSQLTTAGAVSVTSGGSTLTIPALTVRRANTTVELGSGETFAIAGLLQDNITQTNSGIPILGDIPVLGGLFNDNTLEHDQTELVFLVTPYVVKPVTEASALRLPGQRFDRPPNDFERLFLLIQTPNYHTPAQVPPAPGDAGFLVQ
jgi:pilus assembly protein CpaC